MIVRQLCDHESASELDWFSSVVCCCCKCLPCRRMYALHSTSILTAFNDISWRCLTVLASARCDWLTWLCWLTGWLTRLSSLCKFAWRVFLRISLKAEIVGAQYPLICEHENEIHWHQMTFNATTWRGLKAALVLALWAGWRQRQRRV